MKETEKKIDFHVHLSTDYPVDKSIQNLKELCRRNQYETVGIQTLTHLYSKHIPEANDISFQIKKLWPEVILFACPFHDGSSYVNQTKRFMENGADGIKLLIGKPSEYRDLQVEYDDPVMEEFFAYAEREDIPVLLHHNDPKKHWDRSKMSKESIAYGWYYDPEKMPSHEYFDQKLEELLARHPNLRIAIAHMGFYACKLDRLTELMDKYPKLYMDITPALDIYEDLSNDIEKAQVFFQRYSNRLIYGTDCWSDLGDNEKNRLYNEKKVKIVNHFLCGEGIKVIDGQMTKSISLTKKQQEAIYYDNCLRFIKK